MPIVFAPPAPAGYFSAAGAGGRASAMLQGNQLLAQAYGTMASVRQRAEEAQMQAGVANANRMQQDRQYEDTLAERRDATQANIDLGAQDIGLRGAIASAHNEAQFGLQQQHAQLDVWADSQKLSQREKMLADQDQNSIATLNQLWDDYQIDDPEYYDALAKIKSRGRIDLAEQKLKKAQLESVNEMRKSNQLLNDEKIKAMRDHDSYNRAVLGDKITFQPDETKRAEAEQVVTDAMGGAPFRDAVFEQEVQDYMKSKGWGDYYFPNEKGVPTMTPASLERRKAEAAAGRRGPGGGAEMTPELTLKHVEAAQRSLDNWEKSEKEAGRTPSPDAREKKAAEYAAEQKRLYDIISGNLPAHQEKEQAEVTKKQAVDREAVRIDQISQMPDQAFSEPFGREKAVATLKEVQQLIQRYGSDLQKAPEPIKKRLISLDNRMQRLLPNGIRPMGPAAPPDAPVPAPAVNGPAPSVIQNTFQKAAGPGLIGAS